MTKDLAGKDVLSPGLVSRQEGDLRARFRKLYGQDARMFRAPGRVNLIGEHADYNEGFVMPVAMNLHTWVRPRRGRIRTSMFILKT